MTERRKMEVGWADIRYQGEKATHGFHGIWCFIEII